MEGLVLLLLVAQDADEDPGVAHIGGYIHVGDAQKASQAGVPGLVVEDLAYLLPEQVVKALGAAGQGGFFPWEVFRISPSWKSRKSSTPTPASSPAPTSGTLSLNRLRLFTLLSWSTSVPLRTRTWEPRVSLPSVARTPATFLIHFPAPKEARTRAGP